MSEKEKEILDFINILKDVHPVMVEIFTNGGCYEFFRLLKIHYEEAEPWYDWASGHAYVKIDNRYYDINGVHDTVPEITSPLSDEPNVLNKAHTWKDSIRLTTNIK